MQGGSVFFAYQRFQAGADTAFTEGMGEDEENGQYQGYEDGGGYGEQPFEGGGQTGKILTR